MHDAAARAGAAAISRAEDLGVPVDPSTPTARSTKRGALGVDDGHGHEFNTATRPEVLLPDEVVLRILRLVLEASGGEGAHARLSVGGRFRVPSADENRRRSFSTVADGVHGTRDGEWRDASCASPRTNASRVKRGCLRLVSKQWRFVLDQACEELEIRKAVVFGDEHLEGLARNLVAPKMPNMRKITIEGSHAVDGNFALTANGISRALAAVPNVTHLHIERTGMRLSSILAIATRECPRLKELRIVGGYSLANPQTSSPFESALLRAVPCDAEAAQSLIAFVRDAPSSLETVCLADLDGREMFSLIQVDSKRGVSDSRDPLADLRERVRLKELRLVNVRCPDAAAARLVRCLPPNLERLTLLGSEIDHETGTALAHRLVSGSEAPLGRLKRVRVPDRAALGARAASALDEAFLARRESGNVLLASLVITQTQLEMGKRVALLFASRALDRWRVSSGDAETTLSSDARFEPSDTTPATATAKEALRYLASRETSSSAISGDVAHMAGWSPLAVWAATGPRMSRDARRSARAWFENRSVDDSLAAGASRSAALRFAAAATLLEKRLRRFLSDDDAHISVRISESRSACATTSRDVSAFLGVAETVARRGWEIVRPLRAPAGASVDERGNRETLFRVLPTLSASRALACVALPRALAAAAAMEDEALGRDEATSPTRPIPPLLLDAVLDELCAVLVARDLLRENDVETCQRERRERERRERGTANDANAYDAYDANDPLLSDSCYSGGNAFAMLHGTLRWLEERRLAETGETVATIDHPHPNLNAAILLSPSMLPRWVHAGLKGSAHDASIAAEVAAVALARLTGKHESVAMGARGLRVLANVLGAAAKLVRPAPGSSSRCAREGSGKSLHDAVHAIFAARAFAPLLRGGADGACDNDAGVDGKLTKIAEKKSRIISWPQWLHAVGAPPPMDARAANAAALELRTRSEEYERIEVEAASLRARMSRLALNLRSLAADVRASSGFHREPARDLLLRAHRAVGWRNVRDGGGGGGGDDDDDARRGIRPLLQISLLDVFARSEKVSAARVASESRNHRRTLRNASREKKPRTVLRYPYPGWRREVSSALDALFLHAKNAAPFLPIAPLGSRDTARGAQGWSLVNDAEDSSRVFAHGWERRAAAAMLAWYADELGAGPLIDRAIRDETDGTPRTSRDWKNTVDADVSVVLRVLGVSDFDEGFVERGGFERLPVAEMRRLRSEAIRRREPGEGRSLEIDARLRSNLFLDDEEETAA